MAGGVAVYAEDVDVAAHERAFNEGDDAHLEEEHVLAGREDACKGEDMLVIVVAPAWGLDFSGEVDYGGVGAYGGFDALFEGAA